MFNKSDFIAESIFSSRAKLRGMFLKKVFAEEPNGGDPITPPQQVVNYEQLIANARKEEKEKLYPRIKKLEDDNKALISANNDTLIRLAEVTKERDSLKTSLENKQDSEEVAELKDKIATLQAELDEAKNVEIPSEEELRSKIEGEFEQKYKVKEYTMNKLAENKDSILDVFANEVTGNTEEEVDEAIKSVIEKSTKIKKDLGLIDDEGNPISPTKKEETKKEEKPPKVNPKNPKNVDEYTPEQIRNLKPGTPEYAEFRKKLGLN